MVIQNVKLRELVAKGPKYREPNKINWQSTETMISNSIDLYAEQWSKREQVFDVFYFIRKVAPDIETNIISNMREYHEIFGHELPPLPQCQERLF